MLPATLVVCSLWSSPLHPTERLNVNECVWHTQGSTSVEGAHCAYPCHQAGGSYNEIYISFRNQGLPYPASWYACSAKMNCTSPQTIHFGDIAFPPLDGILLYGVSEDAETLCKEQVANMRHPSFRYGSFTEHVQH